ncbi:DUF6176 family protein [Halalkalicoccus sp. NIPERK01]|uniref:DUF6176 family protein n=1 Tax=Halalkalicoccus sp. NIPERK01 TaxID=3053469 RepID=UPI00256F107D|nr:DUF6176 family protein [Halalkalicoccus sp. NIPERK01]MDL5360940.1 DUF6176 family protein [Halalkalicoccus sp. NIPERK01]
MVDVVLLRLRVTPGWPRRVMELFVRILRAEQFVMRRGRLGAAFRRWLNAQLEPILDEEGMHTESVFLDQEGGDLQLLWYMEAESMKGVYEAFEESESALTEGRVAEWLLEAPEKILTTDVESDYPLLAHAWHPDRP